jgi:hypothetical protein
MTYFVAVVAHAPEQALLAVHLLDGGALDLHRLLDAEAEGQAVAHRRAGEAVAAQEFPLAKGVDGAAEQRERGAVGRVRHAEHERHELGRRAVRQLALEGVRAISRRAGRPSPATSAGSRTAICTERPWSATARRAPPPSPALPGADARCCSSERLTSTLRGGGRSSAHTFSGAISGGVAFWRGTAVDSVMRAPCQSSPVVWVMVAKL